MSFKIFIALKLLNFTPSLAIFLLDKYSVNGDAKIKHIGENAIKIDSPVISAGSMPRVK